MRSIARIALLCILATSSLNVAGIAYPEDPSGAAPVDDVSLWGNAGVLWKMGQLIAIGAVISSTYHPGVSVLLMMPFLPCLAWLCLAAAFNGPNVTMARSMASLAMPLLFACACAQTFRSLHDLRAIQKGCLMVLPVGWLVAAVIRGSPIIPTTIPFGLPQSLGTSAAIMTASSLVVLQYAWSRDRRLILVLSLSLLLLLLPTYRIAVLSAVIAHVFVLGSLLGRHAGKVTLWFLPALLIAGLVNGPRLLAKTFEGADQRSTVFGIQMDGRDSVWPLYWEYAMRRPVIGHGPGADSVFANAEGFGHIGCAHNDYLALLIYGGFPAVVLYVGAFVVLLRRVGRLQPRGSPERMAFVAAVGPLLFAAVAATTGQPARNPNVMMPLMAPLAVVVGASVCRAPADGRFRGLSARARCGAPYERASHAKQIGCRL